MGSETFTRCVSRTAQTSSAGSITPETFLAAVLVSHVRGDR